MTASVFGEPAWYLANSLRERLAASRARTEQHGTPTEATGDSRRAATRLQRWRNQLPFREGEYFLQRLTNDGLTEEDFLLHLGESAETIAAYSGRPDWLAELESAYAGLESWPAVDLPEDWMQAENITFLNAVAPPLARARQQVHDGIRSLAAQYAYLPFDPETVENLLLAGLPGHLRRILSRTLVLELNVARLQGYLTGDTPEARYACFVERLCRAGTTLSILREYPVLARQVLITLNHWVAFSLEFLTHLCADWEAVRALLPSAEPGLLADILGNAGDTHRCGRAVLVARFQSGDQVVYKPKSLAVDGHFQTLLTWINERAEGIPPFPIHRFVERDGYGWVEFVHAHGCENEEEVRRFYRRQGGYLALLYALEATDFHSENLIACGEHPILLDLEALFHARMEHSESTRAQDLASEAINNSVMRIGMLPRRIWSADEASGLDVSGLGATGGQLSPHHIPLLEGIGTDSMRLVRKRIELEADNNRPTIDGADVVLADYTEEIVSGFEVVYRLIEAHRESLLAPGGAIAMFSEDVVRVIVRETRTYSMLLTESYHPDVLRDAIDRDRLLDRLWVGVAVNPLLPRVIPHEQADLQRGDIPMFTTRAGSRDLWSSTGERIPDFFQASGMDLVARRLQGMSDADRTRQVWFIRASIAGTVKSFPPPVAGVKPETPVGPEPVRPEALLAQARAIGDRLEALAFRAERGATWLGLNLIDQRYWSMGQVWSDLYNGLPGVALFLAYLGHVTGENRYTELAQAAATTLQQNSPVDQIVGSVGGFNGWGGVLYTLAHLGTLWDRSALLAGARMIAANLPPVIAEDRELNILTGSAGCLAGLLALHRVTPTDAVLTAAVRCGEHLLSKSGELPNRHPGFARGSAGIACALRELTARTGDSRFRAAALGALAAERAAPGAVSDPEAPLPTGPSWGHGAAGQALARLQFLRDADDAELRAEATTELETTLAHGFGHNHSLGLGDLGNLDLLHQASEILGEPRWKEAAVRQTARLLESMTRDGWRCAAPLQVETPSLMAGLSGIGLGLLRLAEPQRVPSVLVFGQPVRS